MSFYFCYILSWHKISKPFIKLHLRVFTLRSLQENVNLLLPLYLNRIKQSKNEHQENMTSSLAKQVDKNINYTERGVYFRQTWATVSLSR